GFVLSDKRCGRVSFFQPEGEQRKDSRDCDESLIEPSVERYRTPIIIHISHGVRPRRDDRKYLFILRYLCLHLIGYCWPCRMQYPTPRSPDMGHVNPVEPIHIRVIAIECELMIDIKE